MRLGSRRLKGMEMLGLRVWFQPKYKNGRIHVLCTGATTRPQIRHQSATPDSLEVGLEMNQKKGSFAIFVVISENNSLAVKRPAL